MNKPIFIDTTGDFLRHMSGYSLEELREIHKALFELSERQEVADLTQTNPLSDALDSFMLYINRVLISKLLEVKNDEH